MKLYELTNDFSELFSQLDDIIENEELTADEREELSQAWFDTLEMIEAEFEDKAENIAVFVKELAAEADALKKEENALAARRKSREKTIERLKSYLLRSMEQVNLKKKY
jgi:outer membrane murein-binding lipoprotein Lpp